MVLELSDFKAKKVVVNTIYIYPVKSCDGIKVDEAATFQKGLIYDRQFVVTDSEYKAIKGDERSKLLTVKTNFVTIEGKLKVELTTESSEIKIYLDPSDHGEVVEASVKETKLKGFKCSDEVNIWISKVLGYEAYLINQGLGHRPAITEYLVRENLSDIEAQLGFTDKYSILLASQESLIQLQTELDEYNKTASPPITMKNFRFNLIVSGIPEPFGEDYIGLATIGNQAKFHFDLPCSRCPFVNENPENLEAKTKLPLQQLMRSRRKYPHIDKYKCFFGISLVPIENGTIRVGDEVQIHKTSEK